MCSFRVITITSSGRESQAEESRQLCVAAEVGAVMSCARWSMSDSDLEAKFSGLADDLLPNDRIRRLIDLCWRVER
jgi:hypothetical protein